MTFQRSYVTVSDINIRFHVKCLTFLYNFNRIQNLSTGFNPLARNIRYTCHTV